MAQEKQERLNITISKEDGEKLKFLQARFNKELMMELSLAQIVRRLINQALAS